VLLLLNLLVASYDFSESKDKNKDKDVIRWVIEVNNLSKQHSGELEYSDQYSIARKSYKGESLVESQTIVVNRKNLFQIKDKIDTILNVL
jgi:hypothetical protein